MASAEAERMRRSLFPSREVPERSVAERRAQELKEAEKTSPIAGICVTRREIAGLITECITSSSMKPNGTILYLHGGGYVYGACATYRNLASHLAVAANANVLVPEYRLAPEHPFPAAVHDAIAIYNDVIDNDIPPSTLVLVGDSAGGALCAALLLALRDANRPLPAAAVLLSPWTDLTLSGDSYRTRVKLDPIDRLPILHELISQYIPNGDATTPLVSPIFGDLRGLPPMLIQVGDHEVLLDDSVNFAQKARAAGVDVELDIWPEMWHGWHLAAPELPEANEAINRIGTFVRVRATSVQ